MARARDAHKRNYEEEDSEIKIKHEEDSEIKIEPEEDDTLAEVLAEAHMVATTKIMRHMHTCDAKEGPEDPPEDPPPHKASRPSKSDGHHMMTREQLDQRFGSTNAAGLARQLYSCPCPSTGSTAPAFVEYRVPDNLLIA